MPSNDKSAKLWIKWWVRETIYGSFMTAPLSELGFFLKLCCLSKLMNYEGQIKSTETQGLPHSAIAGMLNMADNMTEFERLLQVQKDKSRLIEDNAGIITLTNFEYYQTGKGAKQISNIHHNNHPVSEETLEQKEKAKACQVMDYDMDFIQQQLKQRGFYVAPLDKNTGEIK